MRHLLRLVSLRHLKTARTRTLLTLFGVALGIAVVFAIDVVNGSVMTSFRSTIEAISGKSALTVGEGAGVAEELLEPLKTLPGVEAAVPVIEETARDVATGSQLSVLGVDTLSDSKVRDYDVTARDVQVEDELAFLNDPHGVLITSAYAKRTGRKVGDTLTLQTTGGRSEFTIRGTLEPRGPARVFGGDLLLMDVFAAQVAFERGRRFDRIDVLPKAGTSIDVLKTRLEKHLGGKAVVGKPKRRSEEAERILAGFNLGLKLASLVAIFVGAFIVYNALAIAVAQRRREVGILRALGTRRSQVLWLFVGEGLVMGALGSLIGLGLGYVLARSVLHSVGATVSALFIQVKPESLVVTPWQLAFGVIVGVVASFAASMLPAWRAAVIEPATAMRKRVEASDSGSTSSMRSLGIGVGTLALAALVAVLAHVRKNYLLGYAVAGIIAIAIAFFTPSVALGVGRIARRIALRIGPSVRLGADAFERNTGRSAIAIAALGMALGSVVNAGVFVESVKHTTMSWFERTVRADLFIFAATGAQANYDHPLPASIGEGLRKIPGVEFVDGFRMVRSRFRDQPFYISSHELRGFRKYNEFPIVAGDFDAAIEEIAAGRALAASESFVQQFGIELGDMVTLDTPIGPQKFRIALIYVDYNADLGVLGTTREAFVRIWRDTLVDTYGVYLTRNASPDRIRQTVAQTWGSNYGLMVLGNVQYKRELTSLLDRTFALNRATELVALIVAVLGIVNTLLVTVIDRRMEIGSLKAIGALPKQLGRMFLTEAALLGFASALVGIVVGALFSYYIIEELVPFQIGWRMSWQFTPAIVLETLLMAQVVALLGAAWPMRTAARLDVVDALQYE